MSLLGGNNVNGSGKFGLMVLIIFLASPDGSWKVEGFGLGRENGRIQIQEHGLNPSPFKTFLEHELHVKEDERDETGNRIGVTTNRLSPEWETVLDPKLYIITEYDESSLPSQNSKPNEVSEVGLSSGEESAFSRRRRNNNNGHSLSIVNPLDVLRQRLLLEIARRRNLKQNQHQIIANAEILKNIG